MKGIMRFERWGNISPWYIWQFEILWTTCDVVYELALPSAFSAIHSIFHVLILHQYIFDKSHVVWHDLVQLNDHLTFVEDQLLLLRCEAKEFERHSCC